MLRAPAITAFALLCAALAWPAGRAWAHATPLRYMPEASGAVADAPARIAISFSERVEPFASRISVRDPDGNAADTGDTTIDANDRRIVSVGLQNRGEGTYTVSWQVVSADDGHFTKGAFVFSVGQATGTPIRDTEFEVVHTSPLPEATAIWLELLGEAIILGALVILAFIWRPWRNRQPELPEKVGGNFAARFSGITIAGVLLVIAGTTSYALLRNSLLENIGGLENSLSAFLATTAGRWTLVEACAALAFLAVFLVRKKHLLAARRLAPSEGVLWGLAILMCFARARVSHAAASHFLPELSVFVNLLHLVAKNAWVGTLIVLAAVVVPALKRTGGKWPLLRFSRVASVALAVGGASGAYIVWLHLKDPSYLLTTAWGAAFMPLALLGGILLALRLWQQLVLERPATTKEPARKSLLLLEAAVGILLLFFTAQSIITTPPAEGRTQWRLRAQDQDVSFLLEEDPYDANQLSLTISDSLAQHVSVTLDNQEAGIGPLVVSPERRSRTHWAIAKNLFSAPGEWRLEATAQRPGNYDANALWSFAYPNDTAEAGIYSARLTWAMAISAVLAIIIGFELARRAKTADHHPDASERAPRLATGLSFVLALLVAGAWYVLFLKGTFLGWEHARAFIWRYQAECERDGNLWHEGAPVRSGQAVAKNAYLGCSTFVNGALFHFPDREEYDWQKEVTSVPRGR